MAVVYHKKRLFLIALLMGFVDFLIPFALLNNIIVFEAVVFTLSVISVLVAWFATKHVRTSAENHSALLN